MLAAARDQRPLLVLLEVRLDGHLRLRGLPQAQGRERRDHLHVSTMAPSRRTRRRGLLLGADDYLSKPVQASELLARVIAVLLRLAPPSRAQGRAARRADRPRVEVLQLLALGLDRADDRRATGDLAEDSGQAHRAHPREVPGPQPCRAVAIAYQRSSTRHPSYQTTPLAGRRSRGARLSSLAVCRSSLDAWLRTRMRATTSSARSTCAATADRRGGGTRLAWPTVADPHRAATGGVSQHPADRPVLRRRLPGRRLQGRLAAPALEATTR